MASFLEIKFFQEVIEYDDLSSMNYLNQVINETLRMYPQAPRFHGFVDLDFSWKIFSLIS